MTEAAANGARRERLASLAEQVRPTTLAREQLLPAAAPLRPLLPEGGLRRGSVLVVRESMSLLLALVAEASAAGAWIAAVSLPGLGMAAAAEQGIRLDRFALVPVVPHGRWPEVISVLTESLQIVLAAPPANLGHAQARRLAARVRERRAVLIAAGDRWPGPADLELTARTCRWEGLDDHGAGHLQARLVEATSTGRGAASRSSRVRLWLPDRHGRVASAGAVREQLASAR